MKIKHFICLVILLFQFSCKNEFTNGYKYPQDNTISNEWGDIKDSNVLILPNILSRKGTENIKTGMDTIFSNKQYSLWKVLGEKILYNYYLGSDQLRFIWFATLRQEQYVFRFVQSGEKYLLFLKVIRRHKEQRDKDSIDYVKSLNNRYAMQHYNEYLKQKKYFKEDSVVYLDKYSEVAFCTPTEISKKSWEKLICMLDTCHFWTSTPNNYREVIDGETWITEAHLRNAYWFRYETSPHEQYRKISEYAIELIGLPDR